MRRLVLATCLCTLSLSSFAALQKSSGVYFETNVGFSKLAKSFATSSNNDAIGLSYGLNLGYKLNIFSAVEVGVKKYPDHNYGNGIKSDNTYDWHGAIKVIWPFDSGYDVFAKFGLADMHYRFTGTVNGAGSNTEYVGMGGLGATMAIDQNIAIGLLVNTTLARSPVPATHSASFIVNYIF